MAQEPPKEIYEEEGDDEEELGRLKGNYYEVLVTKGAGSGRLEDVQLGFEKKPSSILYEDPVKKWTPLIWASSKNQIQILRFLVDQGALDSYLKVDLEHHPNKCTLGMINQKIKPTPLQCACFQGNLQIVWYLLKRNCRWEDIDQFGNNCVHLAASGGNLKVFESLIMYGVDCEGKNSRNHSVIDLATNAQIIQLINTHTSQPNCGMVQCNIPFDDTVKKHWCQTCGKIYCSNCFQIKWTWETPESEEQERIDGKCLNCWKQIDQFTENLLVKMQEYEYQPLTDIIEEIEQNSIEIDLKQFQKAKELQEQLRTQNAIIHFIDQLKIIENYKTIFKSVHLLKEMKDDAANRGVNIDQNVLEYWDKEIARLNSERKLRFDLDNMQIGSCTPEDKKELSESIEDARIKGVAENYLDESEDMREKMEKSLNAKEIFKLFCEYATLNEEDYPKCFYMDKKTGKVIDPETKKPADSKRFPPPKKKKKKKGDAKLVIPDWAAESPDQLDEKIKILKLLLQSAEECKFDEEFINNCNDQIKRMTVEWKYRVALAEENRLIQEWKLAQKKKK